MYEAGIFFILVISDFRIFPILSPVIISKYAPKLPAIFYTNSNAASAKTYISVIIEILPPNDAAYPLGALILNNRLLLIGMVLR